MKQSIRRTLEVERSGQGEETGPNSRQVIDNVTDFSINVPVRLLPVIADDFCLQYRAG